MPPVGVGVAVPDVGALEAAAVGEEDPAVPTGRSAFRKDWPAPPPPAVAPEEEAVEPVDAEAEAAAAEPAGLREAIPKELDLTAPEPAPAPAADEDADAVPDTVFGVPGGPERGAPLGGVVFVD